MTDARERNIMNRLLWILLLCLVTTVASATNLRGRVDGKHAYAPAPFPASRIAVELLVPDVGGKWQVAYRTVSGPDGMYLFSGVKPGAYILHVDGRLNFHLTVGPGPTQDVAPVVVNF